MEGTELLIMCQLTTMYSLKLVSEDRLFSIMYNIEN